MIFPVTYFCLLNGDLTIDWEETIFLCMVRKGEIMRVLIGYLAMCGDIWMRRNTVFVQACRFSSSLDEVVPIFFFP